MSYRMGRRQLLGAALPLLSLPLLSACGSGKSDPSAMAAPTQAPKVGAGAVGLAASSTDLTLGPKPAVALYDYSAGFTQAPAITTFAARSSQGVTGVPDRLAAGALANHFDGSTSVVVVDGLPALDSAQFSLGLWARTSAAAAMPLLTISDGTTPVLRLSMNPNFRFAVQWLPGVSGAASELVGQVTINDGGWHHVLVQADAGVLKLYVDGRAMVVFSITAAVIAAPVFSIGNDGSSVWSGEIDDVRLYSRPFTEDLVPLLVYSWTQVSEGAAYTPRDGAGLLSFNGRLWVLGGWNPNLSPVTNSEVWSSADGVDWTLETIAPWAGRHTAGWAVHDGQIWVCGGDKLSGSYQNDVWASADGVNWREVTTSVPWANRALTMVVAKGDDLYLMGGVHTFDSSGNVAFNDVYATQDGATWVERTASAPWSPRGIMLGSAVFGDRFWVIGGGTYDTRTYLADVWNSADGVSWERAALSAPWAGRIYHSVAVFAGKLWIIGGATAEYPGGTDEVWYSSDGLAWQQLGYTPWPVRHAQSVCAHQGTLWLTGGSDTDLYNDVWNLSYAA